MKIWCCITAAVLAAVVIGLAYYFLVAGRVAEPVAGRQTIVLSPAERELVLAEMRDFLQATQQITAALADGRPEAAAQAARRVGAEARRAVPLSLVAKLPLGFKQLGFDTHQRFDRLAQDAEDLGDRSVVLRQLGDLMSNCIACHGTYRLEAADRAPAAEESR